MTRVAILAPAGSDVGWLTILDVPDRVLRHREWKIVPLPDSPPLAWLDPMPADPEPATVATVTVEWRTLRTNEIIGRLSGDATMIRNLIDAYTKGTRGDRLAPEGICGRPERTRRQFEDALGAANG